MLRFKMINVFELLLVKLRVDKFQFCYTYKLVKHAELNSKWI